VDERAMFMVWVGDHCRRCGSTDGATAEVLIENRDAILGRHRATTDELAEVTVRLVAAGRVPKWANEHTNAVIAELKALREDAAADNRDIPAADCPTCGGFGWVTVPHPLCVWGGRLVTYRDAAGVDHGRVVTVAVTCDACPKGRAERDAEAVRAQQPPTRDRKVPPRRPTLAQYAAGVGGADGPALLREYERAAAERSRRDPTAGQTYAQMFPDLARKIRAQRGE
jgi:hypothetical protein